MEEKSKFYRGKYQIRARSRPIDGIQRDVRDAEEQDDLTTTAEFNGNKQKIKEVVHSVLSSPGPPSPCDLKSWVILHDIKPWNNGGDHTKAYQINSRASSSVEAE
ncbi:MAG: hypothetical protein L6R35_002454 [Caloplaca aegaea]|nr:MAG: hypothetical protein L6R35_002454 [Caloplaca aegaea]